MDTSINKSNIFIKYEKLLSKLNFIIEQRNKINFEYNMIKERIDEFEAINLVYLDEFEKIKSKKILYKDS